MKICKIVCRSALFLAALGSAGNVLATCLNNNTQYEMRYWYAPMDQGKFEILPAGQNFCAADYSGTFQVWLMSDTPPLMASIAAGKTDTIKVQDNFLVVVDKTGKQVAQSILSPSLGGAW